MSEVNDIPADVPPPGGDPSADVLPPGPGGLTDAQRQRGLKLVLREALFSQTFVTLIGGVILIDFALALGASNAAIGLLAAIPFIAQVLQLPAIFVVEKVRRRRAIVLACSGTSRVGILILALVPILWPGEQGLRFALGGLALYSLCVAVTACAWNSWMRDLIPGDRLGWFASRRMTLTTAVALAVSLAAGWGLTFWKQHAPEGWVLYGYSILFTLGLAAGVVNLLIIRGVPEPPMEPAGRRRSILEVTTGPFRDLNFRRLMIFMAAWSFAINLVAPFFAVYLLTKLGYSIGGVIALSILSQVMNLIFFRVWGWFADTFSNKAVLRICGPAYLLCVLGWTFTTLPNPHALTLPLLIVLHVIMGIAAAGITLGNANIGLKLAPAKQATSFLATNSVVASLAAGVAPILGGQLADRFKQWELSWDLTLYKGEVLWWEVPTLNLGHWDFLFAIALVVGFYALHRLALVAEIGKTDGRIPFGQVVVQTRREIQNFSSVAGLRYMFLLPNVVMRGLRPGRRAEAGEPLPDDVDIPPERSQE